MMKNINIYTLSDNFLNKGEVILLPLFKILLIGVYKYDRNFLLQNPLQLFDDFKEIPDLAFEDESSREELVSVINSVINSEGLY